MRLRTEPLSVSEEGETGTDLNRLQRGNVRKAAGLAYLDVGCGLREAGESDCDKQQVIPRAPLDC